MVDNMNPSAPDGVPGPDPTQAPAKSGGFLSTTTGKIVVGGIAVLVVLGALAGIFLVFFAFSDSQIDVTESATTTQSGTQTPAASEETTVTEREAAKILDTFAYRNIFEPTAKPTIVSTSTADGSSGTTGTAGTSPTSIPENTLYLASIQTVDGVPVATFYWNGVTYIVAEGDELPGTPWKVIEIGDNSAVMLYGDTQVTISVGQGITK